MDRGPRHDKIEANLTVDLQRKVDVYTMCTEMQKDTVSSENATQRQRMHNK